MIRRTHFWGAAVALLISFGSARADSYYVVVFGAQSKPQRPKYSHSWATFVRIPGDCNAGPPAAGTPVETFTISWMPAKIELTPNRLLPETGTNLDLPTSFENAVAHCEHISAFGPYQIDHWLYCQAEQHFRRLEAGKAQYKTIDATYNPRRVSNCIHALTAFDREHLRVRIVRIHFGEVASYYVAESYRRHIICPQQVHGWVADLLGLSQYPIKWRAPGEDRPHPRDEN